MIIKIDYQVSGGYLSISDRDILDVMKYEFTVSETEQFIIINITDKQDRKRDDIQIKFKKIVDPIFGVEKNLSQKYERLTRFLIKEWMK